MASYLILWFMASYLIMWNEEKIYGFLFNYVEWSIILYKIRKIKFKYEAIKNLWLHIELCGMIDYPK